MERDRHADIPHYLNSAILENTINLYDAFGWLYIRFFKAVRISEYFLCYATLLIMEHFDRAGKRAKS